MVNGLAVHFPFPVPGFPFASSGSPLRRLPAARSFARAVRRGLDVGALVEVLLPLFHVGGLLLAQELVLVALPLLLELLRVGEDLIVPADHVAGRVCGVLGVSIDLALLVEGLEAELDDGPGPGVVLVLRGR